ncbi:hypothetical protein [Streptomyces sp. NPDC059455]|uniref:hypothetical protein n=1 Tax=Streptomyces sp. NPDC059455 TaxID=3346837 RepID=UPI0036B4D895
MRVAVHEAAAAMEQNFAVQWAYSATIAQRGELNRPKGRIRCADGWMTAFAMEGRLNELLTAVGADGLVDSPSSSSWSDFMRDIPSAFARIQERARGRSREALLQAALDHRLVMFPGPHPDRAQNRPAAAEQGLLAARRIPGPEAPRAGPAVAAREL